MSENRGAYARTDIRKEILCYDSSWDMEQAARQSQTDWETGFLEKELKIITVLWLKGIDQWEKRRVGSGIIRQVSLKAVLPEIFKQICACTILWED